MMWQFMAQPRQDWPDWVDGKIVGIGRMRVGPEGGEQIKAGDWLVFVNDRVVVYTAEEMKQARRNGMDV